jgi:RNA polymerase sigma factor (sigma-70 family)
MDINVTLWDSAESDFQNRSKSKSIGTSEFSEIILATFVYSRNKLRKEISKLSILGDDELAKTGIVSEPDFLGYDETGGILFRMVEDKRPFEVREKERKEWNKKRNNKIIKGIIENDRKVYLNLYEEEFPNIVRMIIKNSGTIDNARDVFQDGLIILIENLLHKNLQITESFDSYLYSVCRNLWYKQIIQNKRKIKFIDDYSYNELDIDYYNNDIQPDNYEQFAAAIESLGESCRKLLEYYYYQKIGWEEIANQLGYATAGSARNQKYKCLERIRKQLAEINEN